MKKFISFLLVAVLCLALFACSKPETTDPTGTEDPAATTYEVVMVTDLGGVDDGSFNQGTWEGIQRYCDEKGVSYTYLRPIEQTTDGYLTSLGQAVDMGAKIVLCPGYLFEAAIFQAQDLYPDTKFVLIDGYPQDGSYTEFRTEQNVYAVCFSEQEAGFLAGYACVKEGYRKLAFFGGMAVPAVVRFGYGWVEGAEYAAKELGLAKGDVEITYWYSGDFDPSPAKLTTVTGWYESGTEVIFSCGGTIVENVIAAADSMEGKKIVGVDVDQAWMSENIITSAKKNLGDVCYRELDLFFTDSFVGGLNDTLGTAAGMVSLPSDFSRFTTFTQADYDAIYAKLAADEGGISSSLYTADTAETPNDIPLELVTLNYIA